MKGTCRLCLKEAELPYSHVIPEFLYATTYDELHRAIKVTPDKTDNPPYTQKGIRDYLLCSECETRISQYEGYASTVLRSILKSRPTTDRQSVWVPGVNYTKFKLFQMSLLWRSSVTNLQGFHAVSLGPHEEHLRLMILQENPGTPLEYACLLMMFPGGGNVERVVFSPVREQFAGKIYYRFHTGPWFWFFLHPGQFEETGETDLVLSQSGMLRVAIAQWREEEFMNNLKALISPARHN